MILATRSGSREVRDVSFGVELAAMGLTRGTSSSSVVTDRMLVGIPAAKECIRIAAEAVATHSLDVFRGQDVARRKVVSTWQARLFARPNACDTQTWWEAKEGLEASLTSRNNGFWLKHKDAGGRVVDVELLHPDCVDGRWNREYGRSEYRYRIDGGWSVWLTSADILHFRVGHVAPGSVFAPTPAALHRTALKAVLSKATYESNLYENGILQSIAILLDEKVTPEQAKQFQEVFQAEHGGVENQAKIRVIGGGSTVETIGLSLADAQYIDSMQFGISEISRIFGVTVSLLGSGDVKTGSTPLTPEHEQMRWHAYGLHPRLSRIASTVHADPDFFGAASRDYPLFAAADSLADTATESAALVSEVQAGILLPDEARAKRGLGPLPDGVGQLVQVVPVGGSPFGVSDPSGGSDA